MRPLGKLYRIVLLSLLSFSNVNAAVSSRDCRVYYEYDNQTGADETKVLSPWESHHFLLERVPLFPIQNVQETFTDFIKERIQTDQFYASIQLAKGSWDNGQWCYNGQCKCSLEFITWDNTGSIIASQYNTWASTTQCQDFQPQLDAMTQALPDCARTQGATSALAIQKSQTLNQDLCQSGSLPDITSLLQDPDVDPNYQPTQNKPYEGRVVGNSTFICATARTDDDSSPFLSLLNRADINYNVRGIEGGYSGDTALMMIANEGDKKLFQAALDKYPPGAINALNFGLYQPVNSLLDGDPNHLLPLLTVRADLIFPPIDSTRLGRILASQQWDFLSAALDRGGYTPSGRDLYAIFEMSPSSLATKVASLPRVDMNSSETDFGNPCSDMIDSVVSTTPLLWAIWYDRQDIATAILSRTGVNTGFKNECGDTAMSVATDFDEPAIEALLKGYKK